jgi:hypothetical protein
VGKGGTGPAIIHSFGATVSAIGPLRVSGRTTKLLQLESNELRMSALGRFDSLAFVFCIESGADGSSTS